MGFVSGAITFKRFFVGGKPIRQVDEELIEQLKSRAMGPGSVGMSDKSEIGWTAGSHVLDTTFEFEKNAVADGLYFAMRVDANKPPGDLVRSYQKQNEQAMLEASGREFLSKAERREAREQAVSRADAEARAGAFRKMTTIPVFWDLKRSEAYLASASPKAIENFSMLFQDTFDRTVTSASAGEMAARWAGLAGETRAYDDCEPAHFINPPDGAEMAAGDYPANDTRGRDFLGTEWLTWLWFTSHVESAEITTGLSETIAVLFEKSLQLECAYKISGKAGITADAPTRLPEAGVALAGGKRPIRAGLQLGAHGEAFAFSLRGDAMNWSGLIVSPPEDASNPQAVFADRMEKLRDAIDAVGSLYAAFLKKRLSSKWAQTLAAMRQWVASGRHADIPEVANPPALGVAS